VDLFIQKSRNIINKKMVGFSFKVYQGQRFISVIVNNNMVGFRFGEFIKTRKLHVYKKKK